MELRTRFLGHVLVDDLVVHVLDAHLKYLTGDVAQLNLLGLAFKELTLLKTLQQRFAGLYDILVHVKNLPV